jgi:hypothetical protein
VYKQQQCHNAYVMSVVASLLTVLCVCVCATVTTASAQHVACKHWYECPDFAATVSTLHRHGADCEQPIAEALADDDNVAADNDALQGLQAIHLIAASAGHEGSAAAVKVLIADCHVPVDALTHSSACTPAWLVARHACADSSDASSDTSSSSSNCNSSTDTTVYTLECLQQLLDLGAEACCMQQLLAGTLV